MSALTVALQSSVGVNVNTGGDVTDHALTTSHSFQTEVCNTPSISAQFPKADTQFVRSQSFSGFSDRMRHGTNDQRDEISRQSLTDVTQNTLLLSPPVAVCRSVTQSRSHLSVTGYDAAYDSDIAASDCAPKDSHRTERDNCGKCARLLRLRAQTSGSSCTSTNWRTR
jgi:hypothetical protein